MKDIIIFGTGKYLEHKKDLLQKYNVICIIDNKIERGHVEEYKNTGIRLINPNDLNRDGEEQIFLASMYFVSMWEQLVNLGVDPQRLVYPYFIKPYFQSDSVVDILVSSIRFDQEKITVSCKEDGTYFVKTCDEWNKVLRELFRKKFAIISSIAQMDSEPVSGQFATERGTPVDRFYIEEFLSDNRSYIRGDVLEIEDNTYTKRYGGENVTRSIVMDYDSKAPDIDFNIDLESGRGVRDGIADCFICTQTLMYIFDLKAAAKNICRLLKPGGTALITCSGLSQNSRRCMENYGVYWAINEAVFQKMFAPETDMRVVSTGTYGNVKTVTAHINGLCVEDLCREDFERKDICYPLIVYVVVRKNG